ncbi:MAG: TatD family hydrolase [Anaerolineales bacterium]
MSAPALVDTHCHLDLDAFDADRPQVIERAVSAGVTTIINPSVNLESNEKVVALAQEHAPVYASVGIHPNDSVGWGAEQATRVRALAQHPKVVAIGEIGLDYYWDRAPKGAQQRALRDQLELAAELELPVIVHNREAGDDLLAMLQDWQSALARAGSPLAERPGVLHSFSSDGELAEKAIAARFFIGLTGPLTFKNAKDLQSLATKLPLESLLVETDSPYLSPHPHRGQRNEPAKVTLVAEKLAAIKAQAFEAVAAATTANAQRLFQFGART